jgi:hypothetical protein
MVVQQPIVAANRNGQYDARHRPGGGPPARPAPATAFQGPTYYEPSSAPSPRRADSDPHRVWSNVRSTARRRPAVRSSSPRLILRGSASRRPFLAGRSGGRNGRRGR